MLTPEAAREGRAKQRDDSRKRRTKAQVVQLEGVGVDRAGASPTDDAPSPGAPTDAEVRTELRQARASLASFKKHLNTTAFLQTGPRARVLRDGTAIAPDNAPDVVKRVIMAGNEIAKFPYKWGGGHGAWRDNGYDCSGSVSFALAGAGLLGRPLTSGLFMNYGSARPGPLDHDLRQPRPHLHVRGRAAVRHERPGPRRHPLAGGHPRHRGLRGAPHPRALGRAQPASSAGRARARSAGPREGRAPRPACRSARRPSAAAGRRRAR